MFSFWGRLFLYLVLALVFLVVSVYGFWIFWYHEKGAPWVDALLWFRNSKLSFFLLYSFALGFWAFALGVFASSVFFLGEIGELSLYENLRERSDELERKVSTLTQKERELRERGYSEKEALQIIEYEIGHSRIEMSAYYSRG